MPRYDFRCRACGDTFEVTRPLRDAAEPATCPAGHDDTVKLLPGRARRHRQAAVHGRRRGPGERARGPRRRRRWGMLRRRVLRRVEVGGQ